eukprot:m.29554 g.29554  ORF g.29554 m.29554 type:complete len:449 (+) comp13744_c0_seq3:245-1591(+)
MDRGTHVPVGSFGDLLLPRSPNRRAEETPGNGSFSACIQLLQGNLSPGMLILPFIFTIGGIATSSILVVVVVLLAWYAMRLVLRAKEWLHRTPKWISVADCDRPSSYQDIGRELLGRRAAYGITFCVLLLQLGTSIVFVSYAGENMCAVERYYVSRQNVSCLIPDTDDYPLDPQQTGNETTVMPPCTDDDIGGDTVLTKPIAVAALTPLALLLATGRTPSLVTVSTMCATALTALTLIMIGVLIGRHFTHFYPGAHDIQVTPDRPQDLLIVFGNLMYTATACIGIFMPIENAMRGGNRTQYGTVVTKAMTATLVLFLTVGILANVAFGRQQQPDIATAFVVNDAADAEYISVINVLLALSVVLTLPLQLRPVFHMIERYLRIHSEAGAAVRLRLQVRAPCQEPCERSSVLPAHLYSSTCCLWASSNILKCLVCARNRTNKKRNKKKKT